jgi:hypothetical protein
LILIHFPPSSKAKKTLPGSFETAPSFATKAPVPEKLQLDCLIKSITPLFPYEGGNRLMRQRLFLGNPHQSDEQCKVVTPIQGGKYGI